ncbi:uncharacterized protein LOC142162050 [Nicotiana tabacum]|uniref:Uncharacterized protein LOC142162050 n=1 Tax=Nicotiana tabacum TaxID=4097 RepID=A0AC58RP01_TOBAC
MVCLCYATNLVKIDKFAERAKAVILIGYFETQKGYVLFDLDTKQFFTSRDVIFRESEFSFAKKDGNSSLDAQEYIEEGILQFSLLHTQPGSNIYDRNVSTSTAEDMVVQDNRQNDLQDNNLLALHETNIDDMHEVPQNVEDMDIVYAGTQSNGHHDGVEALNSKQEDEGDKNLKPERKSTRTTDIKGSTKGQQVYKIKFKADGEVERFKARLVAKEYSQREGLDYHDTFSPVAEIVNVRSVISLAASRGDLNENLYMELPKGFRRKGEQKTVSRSSAEAAYRSMAASIAEVTWLLGLFKELGVSIAQPITFFSDSKSAIQLAANPVLQERTKHIEIDCHFIRDKIKKGTVKAVHVNTKE